MVKIPLLCYHACSIFAKKRIIMNKKTSIFDYAHAVIAVLMLTLSTLFWVTPIVLLGFLKCLPIQSFRRLCTRLVDRIAIIWVSFNNRFTDVFQNIQWTIKGKEQLPSNKWYLIISNHQSWLDIVVLQRVFHRKVPVLKFFIKEQLKWVPFLNVAWWAMGCPFMKRYSAAYLEKYPHKKGRDIIATQKAMQAFKQVPASIMNFVEGTRFTALKKQLQDSPYQHLLKPKAGGLSLAIATLGDRLSGILDVTISYSQKQHSLWDFLCRRVDAIQVHVRHIAIPSRFQTLSLLSSPTEQKAFREWLNSHWMEKDKYLQTIRGAV